MLQNIFQIISYPLMLAMVTLAGFELSNFLYKSRIEIKKYRSIIISSLLLTIIVAMSVRHEFRTLSDETNLLSTSQSLLFRHSTENVLTAESWYGILNPTSGLIPKRPILYPFMMSIVHMVFGFKTMAGAYVNLSALFVLLLIIGVISRKLFGFCGALGVQLLMLSHPLISLYATCGGFDLFAATMLVLCIYFTANYINHKTQPNLSLLFIFLTMLCHCRYESFAYVAIIVSLLLFFKYLKIKDLFTKYTAVCFVFITPIVIQRIFSMGQYEQPDGAALFSMAYLTTNALIYLDNFYRTDLFLPYNVVLFSIATIGGVPFLFYLLLRKLDARTNKNVNISIIAVSVILANLAVIGFHVAGDITANTQVRYFIPFCIATVFLCVVIVHLLKFTDKAILTVGLSCFAIFHPIAVEDRMHQQLLLNRELKWEMEYLGHVNTKSVLIIATRAGLFTAQRMTAISFEIANINGKRLQVERAVREKLYDKALVIQHIYYESGLDKTEELPEWSLNPIVEKQLSYDHFVRISEVVTK